MHNNLISVVIPTYNRGGAIEKTVVSVLKQDVVSEEIEIIIVDDGSTDDTFTILQTLYGNNPRVRLFSTPNGGVARARNFGLEQARGEFIAYLDHDDLWMPQKLRLQREKMIGNSSVGVVYCNWVSVDESGFSLPDEKQLSKRKWWHAKEGWVYPWVYSPSRAVSIQNSIISMSIPLIRVEEIKDVGGFDPEMVPCDDWDLWIRLAKKTQFAYVDQILVNYVCHFEQQHMGGDAIPSTLRVMEKHYVKFTNNPALWFIQKTTFELLKFNSKQDQYLKAKKLLFKRRYLKCLVVLVKMIIKCPIALFNKRWMYIFYRVMTFQSKVF